MELLLLKSLLWIGLILFFFAIKHGLRQLEIGTICQCDELDTAQTRKHPIHFDSADNLMDPIAQYLDLSICGYSRTTISI